MKHAVAALLALLLAGCGGGAASDSVGSSGTLPATIRVGSDAFALAADGTTLWVARHDGAEVVRVDASRRRVVGRTSIGGEGTSVGIAGGSVWVPDFDHHVYRLDARTGEIRGRVALPKPDQLAVAPDGVWITSWERNAVSRIEPESGRVAATLRAGAAPNGAEGVSAVAVAAGSVWVVRGDQDAVFRLSPRGAVQARVAVGDTPSLALPAGGAVWIGNFHGSSVSRIDPATNRVTATVKVGLEPGGLAAAGGTLYVTSYAEGTLTRIEMASARAVSTRPVCPGAAGLAVAADALWVACRFEGTVKRVPLAA